MKRLVALAGCAAVAASAFVLSPAQATPGTPEGCVLSNPGPGAFPPPGQTVGGTSCSYESTVAGNYGGYGAFTITVYADSTKKTVLLSVHNTIGQAYDTNNPIPAGAYIEASIDGSGSGLAVGNPTGS